MMRLRPRAWLGLLFAALLPLAGTAQQTAPPSGLRTKPLRIQALTNATVVPAPGQKIEKATILIQDGVITAIGTGIAIPAGTPTTDLKGQWVYPGLVDAYSHYGLPEIMATRGFGGQEKTSRPGPYYWNMAVQPEGNVADLLKVDADLAAKYRSAGFTSVHVAHNDGVIRGAGAIMLLGDGNSNDQLLRAGVSAGVSLNKGSSPMSYPSSLMGGIALIRQAFSDAQWYANQTRYAASNPGTPKVEYNRSLEALSQHMANKTRFFFPAGNVLDMYRMQAISKEFGVPYVLIGTGFEYERMDDVVASKPELLLPLTFPTATDVEDPADALSVSLQNMRRWEAAPANAVWLHQKGLAFGFTMYGQKDVDAFLSNLRKVVALGLPEAKALEALTTYPARLIGADRQVGTLERGKLANLVIVSGNLFTDGAVIRETWVAGSRYAVNPAPAEDVRGSYVFRYDGRTDSATVAGDPGKLTLKVKRGPKYELAGAVTANAGSYLLTFASDTTKGAPAYRLRGNLVGESLSGSGELNGKPVTFAADRWKAHTTDAPKPGEAPKLADIPTNVPNWAYDFVGAGMAPTLNTVLIRNATVWTNTAQGILQNTDVLLEGGKIKAVGKGLQAPAGAVVVDGTGKHLTAGIIDEHTHIATDRGVNEGTQAVSAEVRMGDNLDPMSIQIYRQLAGGVTAAQVLHGSANPVGGQSQIIKLRWGTNPEGLKFENAPRFIKFALGENVKQTHWGDASSRYPKSRMGVEQLFKDAFQAAKEYQAEWEAWRKAGAEKSGKPAPRRDLELEALAEILRGERFITCHSYLQSEITMLIRLGEEMGFKVNTFTHILEGYKVADKMAAHGAAASTFADWWAYKNEVYEAIPHNPALMAANGVNVAINSDDAEMARRLNQEAAKSVKYAGMSEEEAFRMVSLNPARMLHIDNRVGSIEAGKDADVVLWDNNPLSIYARPAQTYVDGRLMFDLKNDQRMREILAAERNRLVAKLLAAKKSGVKATKPAVTFSWGEISATGHMCDYTFDFMSGAELSTQHADHQHGK